VGRAASSANSDGGHLLKIPTRKSKAKIDRKREERPVGRSNGGINRRVSLSEPKKVNSKSPSRWKKEVGEVGRDPCGGPKESQGSPRAVKSRNWEGKESAINQTTVRLGATLEPKPSQRTTAPDESVAACLGEHTGRIYGGGTMLRPKTRQTLGGKLSCQKSQTWNRDNGSL